MRTIRTLSIFLTVSAIAKAEHQETIILYQGTPEKIIWNLEKNNVYARLAGDIHFKGITNASPAAGGYATWDIPAFDTKSGTRQATGFRIEYEAYLRGNFHADAGTTHNRKIETFHRWAGLTVDVQIFDGGIATSAYTANSYGGEFVDIPKAEQRATLDWNLNTIIQDEGWTLRPLIYPQRKAAFNKITHGKGQVTLQGNMFWDPYFTFQRKEYGGSDMITAYADTGTSQWEIPNENVADQIVTSAYPVDALGRRIDAFVGLPGYPAGSQPQNARNAVYSRTGASGPVSVSITYFFTRQGDPDHGKSTYSGAGRFAEDFETMDNSQYFFMDPANWENHNLPGNKTLEFVEFARLAGKSEFSSGIQLYDFAAIAKSDPVYGLNITYHFRWMDANRDGVVSMVEFRNWRVALETASAQHKEPGKHLPDANWETFPPPPNADVPPNDPKLGWKDSMVFKALDTNRDGKLSKTEWKELQKHPSAFKSLDRNHDNFISSGEILKAGSAGLPQAWRTAVKRAEFFTRLDRKAGKKDGKLALSEFKAAWNPGTKITKIKSDMKRMAGGKLRVPIRFRDFMNWKSTPADRWKTATKLRALREAKFHAIRSTYLYSITNKEFAKLFIPETPAKKITRAWNIATNTKKGQNAPPRMTKRDFIECRLVGASIR